MSDGRASTLGTVGSHLAKAEAKLKEHERRMVDDPAYRAAVEKRDAECAKQEAADRRYAENQRRAAIAKARSDKGIPEKFFPYLDAWREGAMNGPASVEKARGWVSRLLAEGGEWVFLFLAGPVGVGKTAGAAWFLDAPLTRFEPNPFGGPGGNTVTREAAGLFVTADSLAKASTFSAEFWDRVRDTPRLVIDDLGVERLDDKGWALANLAGLLCHRHANGLPTVLTLNMTQRAFEERYAAHDGGRLRDRLKESAFFAEITGPSLRRPLFLGSMAPNPPSGATSDAAAGPGRKGNLQ